MNTNALLLMQGLLAGIQFANAGLAAAIHGPHSLLICLIVGSVAAGLQVTVQQIGNQTTPKAQSTASYPGAIKSGGLTDPK
jgi:hypothetical protein